VKLELITPEGPREVRTSVSGWEDFMRSAAWLDMQDAIKLRINELFEEFRIETDPADVVAVARIKFYIAVLEEFLELPEWLKDEALGAVEDREVREHDRQE